MPPLPSPLTIPRISPERVQGPTFFDDFDFPNLSLPFGQAWLPALEPAFRPGTVRLALAGDTLLVSATLSDDHITTTATADQQFLWELGDVFEIFMQAEGHSDYHEFQLSPGNHLLSLHYPHPAADRTRGLASYLRPSPIRDHEVEIEPTARRWHVALRLPLSSLLPPGAPLPLIWQMAACRYDYHKDGTFTLASTAQLTKPQFHRIADWTRIKLPPPTA